MAARKKRFTKRDRVKLLEEIAEHGNLTAAAEAIGRPRSAVYALQKDDPGFAQAMAEARESALYGLEAKVIDWANNGYTVMTQESDAKGNVTKRKAEKKYDPRLALRVLERRHPDYKPRTETEVTGKSGVLIVPGMIANEEDFDAAFGSGTGG